jgi:hypothetical protein
VSAWSKRIGEGSAVDVDIDRSGSTYVVGQIFGAFDPSVVPAFQATDASASAIPDGFVVKFDPAGKAEWQTRWPKAPASNVVADSQGNIVAVGLAFQAIDLGQGPISIPDGGIGAPFVTKYDAKGRNLWALPISGLSIAIDADDQVLVLESTFDHYAEAALAKLGPDGQELWKKRIGSGRGLVAAHQGSIAVVVEDLGDDAGALVSRGLYGNVAMLDPAGDVLWSRRYQGTGAFRTEAIAFDGAGNVIVGATFTGEIDIGAPSPIAGPTGDPAAQAILVAKYDAAGRYVWHRQFGVMYAQDWIQALAVAPNGDEVFTGEFSSGIDFGAGPLTTEGPGDQDLFLARLDSSGRSVQSARYGNFRGSEFAWSVAAGAGGQVALAGWFEAGSIDFGNGPISWTGERVHLGMNEPPRDAFVALFAP